LPSWPVLLLPQHLALPSPSPVGGLTKAVAVSAGNGHTCAALADGGATCWGNNSGDAIGDGGAATQRLLPVSVVGLGSTAVATEVSAGGSASCVTLQLGETGCWGSRTSGRMGNGTYSGRQAAPGGVAATLGAQAVAVGSNHTCVAVYPIATKCWGLNDSGQLGDSSTTNRNAPVYAGTFGTVALAAGQRHTCALRFDGTVRCWGDNLYGQLGDGTNTDRNVPTQVPSLSGVVALTAGDVHTCALLFDGTAKCWGDNVGGQLGTGTTAPANTPAGVTGLFGAVSITGGNTHTCAALLNGTSKCWGTGAALGIGSTGTQTTPQTLSGLDGVFSIDAGVAHTCAVVTTSTLWGALRCWGANTDGQLGDGSTTQRTSPVASSGLDYADTVTSGFRHTCALISTNTAPRCWGDNAGGQLGDGTTTDRTVPTAVTGVTDAVAIAAGEYHTCAIRGVGVLNCWGSNLYGQLGDSTTTNRLTATPVTGLG
jgi:alpha-tubulin suppressor-like RCC1 family protein